VTRPNPNRRARRPASKRIALAALLVLAAAGACVATAWSAVGDRPAATPVVFGADAFYASLDTIDANGDPSGFDVELFREVARHAGMRPEFRLADWDWTIAEFEAGRVQVMPMPITEARRRKYLFSTTFLHRNLMAFGRPGAAYVDSIDDLRGYRVALHQSDIAADAVNGMPGVTPVPVRIEGAALLEVKQGRADYALVPMFIGYEAQKRYRLKDVVAVSTPMLHYEYAFAVMPANRHLLPRINEGLNKAGSNGDYDRLYRKWLANLVSEREAYRSGVEKGVWFALPALAMVGVLLIWWRRARRVAIREAGSRARAEAHIEYLAFHDAGTRLLNPNGLERATLPLIDRHAPFVLIRAELEEVDAMEAITGREFIRSAFGELARRLGDAYSAGRVARIGPQAFIVVVAGVEGADRAEAEARALVHRLAAPMEVAGLPVQFECRAGAALFPLHGAQFDALLSAASLACAAARQRSAACLVYERSLAPDPRTLTLLAELRAAIGDGSLGFALQPKIDLASGAVTGAEMLVRWTHPVHGPLAPMAFVPAAEKTDVIGDMTLYLAGHAISLCREWKRQGRALKLAVNISVNDLSDARVVGGIAELCGGIGDRLILEVTETAVMRDPHSALAAIRRLRTHGIHISLDDFGTGSASLTHLRQMAPDEVKVDRSFVGGVLESEADRAIVRSTIDLAHSVGAVVTAEGIEDAATLDWLAAAGCDQVQGYFIARPMPVDAFIEFYRARHAAH
jgi:EAL domain-containing protein (putative c-di-GMP-specific phosphodiesterase class I)/ABC-type amino acid transport substrate-binding protein/GGDEF domain-containing protein